MKDITNSGEGGGAAAAESHADDTSTYDARAAAAANLAANIATARAAYITSSPAPEKMSKTMGGRNLAAMIVNRIVSTIDVLYLQNFNKRYKIGSSISILEANNIEYTFKINF